MLNVYAMNEIDCIAAESWEEAKDYYKNEYVMGDTEIYNEAHKVDIQEKQMWIPFVDIVKEYMMKNNLRTTIRYMNGRFELLFTYEQVLKIDELRNIDDPYLISSKEI